MLWQVLSLLALLTLLVQKYSGKQRARWNGMLWQVLSLLALLTLLVQKYSGKQRARWNGMLWQLLSLLPLLVQKYLENTNTDAEDALAVREGVDEREVRS
jgi:hypothetical protein